MKTVLLTGFTAFGGKGVNPSQLVVSRLNGREISGHRIDGCILHCVFGGALVVVRALVRDLRPDLVICVGQAGGRAEISLERVAINVADASIPDNAGESPVDIPVVKDGPAAYFSTLPIKSIVAALQSEGIPAAVSNTAGTFVCNHVFYGLMHELRGSDLRGGFIHVPFCTEQDETPSMPLETIERALIIAVEVTLATFDDVKISGGTTH